VVPPVLLLHGGLANSNYGAFNRGTGPSLYGEVMDTRGHGPEPRHVSFLRLQQFAEEVVALLDQLGIERIAIVGWSDVAITGLEPCLGQTGEGIEIVRLRR
jgi:pimeloyl-ACP methyl ester carboxylesterase